MNNFFIKRANENFPEFFSRKITCEKTIKILQNSCLPFGAQIKECNSLKNAYTTNDSFVLDFEDHYVGKFSFNIDKCDTCLDAPVKLKIRFAEMPFELLLDSLNLKSSLSSSWIQEEIVYVDYPGVFEMSRRYSFRYVEITVLSTPRYFKLNNFTVTATTCADQNNNTLKYTGPDKELESIDRIAAKTLMDCMQEVYEDGPKRDRRLWSGDLRLQALTDSMVFKNYNLTKRCLYLFAACHEEGKYLPGCLFHKPVLAHDQNCRLMDYALLYTVTLCDYFNNTNDIKTAKELFPVIKEQIDLVINNLDSNGIVSPSEGWWVFIDWADNIRRRSSVHGVFLYALQKNIALAKAINETETAKQWEAVLEKAKAAALKTLYDSQKGAFINEYDNNQYSVHSQVWLILGGAVNKQQGQRILKEALSSNNSLKPVTPYMHHYVVEAMIYVGMMNEALEYIKNYWGGMIKLGADTFWEVYVPNNLSVSPYGNAGMNSFCHAWSCSPAYFIRKYFNG